MKRAMSFILSIALLFASLPSAVEAGLRASGSASSISPGAFPLLAPDGTQSAPSYSFSNDTGVGFYRTASNAMGWATATNTVWNWNNAAANLGSGVTLGWSSATSAASAGADTILARDAAGILALKNGANAQALRIYFSTTGPVHLGITARTAGGVLTATGGAMQLSTVQTTAPTCTTNCGTSPSVAGTDTAMIVTLGTTPASAFLITFNGTWPAAPACVGSANTAGTTKAVTSVTTTTTTATVTTAAAPATGDKYSIICMGVS